MSGVFSDKFIGFHTQVCCVQARLADFSRRFNEAAVKYHDLSFEQDIVEEERIFML